MSCAKDWKRVADELPDDEISVLLALVDGEVWPGFHLDGEWRYLSADLCETEVSHWMDLPAHPGGC